MWINISENYQASDCVHVDVCENRFSWLDQEDNTKHIVCRHFKDKSDVVEVVRCKDCTYWQDNNGGYPHKECRWGKGETPDSNDFAVTEKGRRPTVEQSLVHGIQIKET